MRRYRYVGPPEIRAAAAGAAGGAVIATRADLARFLAAERELVMTYVVTSALRVASRRSEHVACAAGEDVLAAGELVASADARIVEASNLSTGYCPEPACWAALAAALDGAQIPRPPRFTHAFEFRRCPECGERNLVKDDVYTCALCDADLPAAWNF